jgi:hypothetical protein
MIDLRFDVSDLRQVSAQNAGSSGDVHENTRERKIKQQSRGLYMAECPSLAGIR